MNTADTPIDGEAWARRGATGFTAIEGGSDGRRLMRAASRCMAHLVVTAARVETPVAAVAAPRGILSRTVPQLPA
jgi:hypothetical protein